MKCEICNKPIKTKHTNDKRYCQYHNWDEQMAYLEKQKREQAKNKLI